MKLVEESVIQQKPCQASSYLQVTETSCLFCIIWQRVADSFYHMMKAQTLNVLFQDTQETVFQVSHICFT